MAQKTKNRPKCLGDHAEKWARKNGIPYPKGSARRTMADPEYMAMYNQWPGFHASDLVIPAEN